MCVEHDVDAGLDELLVGVEAREAAPIGDILAALSSRRLPGFSHAILEQVGEGDDV